MGRHRRIPAGRGVQDRQSKPASLSCRPRSAQRDNPAISANSATPVSAMGASAANMRGMLSWQPVASQRPK